MVHVSSSVNLTNILIEMTQTIGFVLLALQIVWHVKILPFTVLPVRQDLILLLQILVCNGRFQFQLISLALQSVEPASNLQIYVLHAMLDFPYSIILV